MRLVIVLIIILLGFANILSASEKERNDSLILLLNKYRPLFIEQLDDTLIYPMFLYNKIGDSSVYINKGIFRSKFYTFLTDELPHYSRIEDIENNLNLTILFPCMNTEYAKKWIPHLKAPEGNWASRLRTGFIENEKYFYLCVKLFKFGYPSMKKTAYKTLINSRSDYLTKYNKEIREVIGYYRIEKSRDSTYINRRKGIPEEVLKKQSEYMDKLLPGDELLIMLPVSSEEKKKMLEKIPEIPGHKYYYLRARLGDKKAEEYFIEQFENAKNYKKKKKFAEKLGIIGTPDCARALVKALNSPIRYTFDVKPLQSVRIAIIKALGRIHPEVPFLRMDIAFIEEYTDVLYGGSEKIGEYLDRVISWAINAYKVKPVDKNPGNFLFPRKGGIIADPGPRKPTKDTPSWNVIQRKNKEK